MKLLTQEPSSSNQDQASSILSNYLLLLLIPLILTSGCSSLADTTTAHEYLDIEWKEGQTWTVTYRIWPKRKKDPKTESSKEFQRQLQFKLSEKSDAQTIIRVTGLNDRARYRLQFGPRGNLLKVDRTMRESSRSIIRLKTVLENTLQNTAMFAPDGKPRTVAPWFFPDLSVSMNDPTKRLNFGIRSSRTNKWVLQSVQRKNGALEFVLQHDPRDVKVMFLWRRGDPWWYEYRWYQNSRIIAYGKLN